jgi:transposase
MATAFSVDLRARVIAYHQKTKCSRETLAETFGVGAATAYRWLVAAKAGILVPGKAPGAAPLIPNEKLPALRALVEMKSDATLKELCEAWRRLHGVKVSPPTMHRMLVEKLGISRKKRRHAPKRRFAKT